MADQQHVVRTREAWQRLLEEQRSSGQGQDAFCAAHGLCKSTLQAWKRRLYGARGSTVQAVGAPGSRAAPVALFTPLVHSGSGRESATTDTAGWTVELELGNGLCLRLRPGA